MYWRVFLVIFIVSFVPVIKRNNWEHFHKSTSYMLSASISEAFLYAIVGTFLLSPVLFIVNKKIKSKTVERSKASNEVSMGTGVESPAQNNEPLNDLNDKEDSCYEQALNEYETNKTDRATYAKAIVESNGDQEKTRATYIKLRVEKLLG
jgi:hypothetical protein